MPQGRRKIPFSGKAKKAQMMHKREVKESKPDSNDQSLIIDPSKNTTSSSKELEDVDLTSCSSKVGRSRYELRFKVESKKELEAMRLLAKKPLPLEKLKPEMDVESMFPVEVEFPKRPEWDRKMSKVSFEINEEKYFRMFVDDYFSKWGQDKLSYFELNLETWRQLWRVMEMSDVLILVVDIRYAPAMTPPSLFRYIQDQKKGFIVTLNKVDLVSPSVALAWKRYYEKTFSGVYVTFFTSCPSYNLRSGLTTSATGLNFRQLKGRISMVPEGAQQVLEACKCITQGSAINLDSWESKIRSAQSDLDNNLKSSDDVKNAIIVHDDKTPVLTIGMIGQPNAGKSSLINSLLGRKSVSVSRTPGHTKHFQTIFVTESVKLCDCPGLVFPSFVPKPLQVIMGSFPIAQVREPYSVIMYLAEYLDLPWMLSLSHHPSGDDTALWSAIDICEAWANKRCYFTAKSNRPDTFRAANHILRMTLAGKLTLRFVPPGFDNDTTTVEENESELSEIRKLLGIKENESSNKDFESDKSSSDSDKSSDEDQQSSDEPDPKMKTHNMFTALMDDNQSD